MSNESGEWEDALVRAQETIAWQAEKIECLEGRLADERFAEDLRGAMTLVGVAGTYVRG
jgi:hypothetical protein